MMPQSYYPAGTDLRFVQITAEEEKTLFRLARTTEEGADNAREFLLTNHLLFVANFARKLIKGKLPEDDVISAANEALITAFNQFNPEHGSRFTSYLKPIIVSAIARLWTSRNLVKYPPGKWPEPPKDIESKPIDPAIVEHPVEAEDHANFMKMALERASDSLTIEEKKLLTEVYENDKSLSDLARERGISRQAVHQAHKVALNKLRAELHKQGVDGL